MSESDQIFHPNGNSEGDAPFSGDVQRNEARRPRMPERKYFPSVWIILAPNFRTSDAPNFRQGVQVKKFMRTRVVGSLRHLTQRHRLTQRSFRLALRRLEFSLKGQNSKENDIGKTIS